MKIQTLKGIFLILHVYCISVLSINLVIMLLYQNEVTLMLNFRNAPTDAGSDATTQTQVS